MNRKHRKHRKTTRLLRVEDEPAAFAPLVAAMADRGMRCGWLDLANRVEPPPTLESAAGLGMLRAVAAGGDRAVVVKPVRGRFVLRDLLREHFRGCDLVLVLGAVEAACLSAAPGAEGWVVRAAGGEEETLSTDGLVDRLRRPGWPPVAIEGDGDPRRGTMAT